MPIATSSPVSSIVEHDHPFAIEADRERQRLNDRGMMTGLARGGAACVCQEGEEATLHHRFVREIETSLRAESGDACFPEIAPCSGKEFRRLFFRGAMWLEPPDLWQIFQAHRRYQ